MSSENVGDGLVALLNAVLPSVPLEAGDPAALTAAFVALVPAVPLSVGQKMLGDKARSQMYGAQAEGLLEFVKDGNKTLVTTRSLLSYQQARFKPFAKAKLSAPPGPKARRRKAKKRGPIEGSVHA